MDENLEKTFSGIYSHRIWGGEEDFFSGPGSRDEHLTDGFISELKLHFEGLGLSVVDIGCGDYTVGAKLATIFSLYIGCDIVKPLIQRNSKAFGSERVSFQHLDITKKTSPAGDVLVVRQVLQHLSNAQIASALTNIHPSTKYLVFTDHHPAILTRANRDMPAGSHIRAFTKPPSGVVLHRKPFSLQAHLIARFSQKVSGQAGKIVTYIYKL